MGPMKKNYTLRELCRFRPGTFAEVIYRNATLYPDTEAFVCEEKRITFQAFNKRSNQLANSLKNYGVKKGAVIGVLSWNRLEYADVFGAAMKGGYILAHLNPRLNSQELKYLINDSESIVLFIEKEFVPLIKPIHDQLNLLKKIIIFNASSKNDSDYEGFLEGNSQEEPDVDIKPTDPLSIVYTSGTTGVPKGALYTHGQKMDSTVYKALDIGAQLQDRHLLILPMFHIGGDSHLWPFFVTGGCNVIVPSPSFKPESVLSIIEKEKITDVQIVPTQLVSLINFPDVKKYALKTLKRIWYAASPMPVEILKKGISIFGPIFMQGYGMTESGPHTTVLKQVDHTASRIEENPRILSSCGQPGLGVQIRIVDEKGEDIENGEVGEIIVRSNRVMESYWQKPEETTATIKDGWLYTGDMAWSDDRGFIYIADRKKDMIVSGGENVYPKEVEDILYRHPDILEAAVVGAPDPYWVERVHAVIVLKENTNVSADEIIKFCKEHIAGYKTPKSIELVNELPKSPQGKILKKEIRKRLKEDK